MALNVDIWKTSPQFEDIKVGTLSYDRETKRLNIIGDDKQLLMDILEDSEVGPPPVKAEDDPELFLTLLHRTYRSLQLRATDTYEGEPGKDEPPPLPSRKGEK